MGEGGRGRRGARGGEAVKGGKRVWSFGARVQKGSEGEGKKGVRMQEGEGVDTGGRQAQGVGREGGWRGVEKAG